MCPPDGSPEHRGAARRSARELAILRSLAPHTRAHAVALLGVHPALVVTSGRRSPRRNREVGGSPTSFHLEGRAVDLDGPLPLLQAAADTAWSQRISAACTGPEEVLLEGVHVKGEHLHVAW